MRFQTVLLLTSSLLILTACPQNPIKPNSTKPKKEPQWKNLGVSPNGNILNELELNSVKRSGNIITFRDKKTIFDPIKEKQPNSVPVHRYSINTWEINCSRNTFQLKNMSLYDKNNRLITTYKYTDNQIKPMLITPSSASYQQKTFLCK